MKRNGAHNEMKQPAATLSFGEDDNISKQSKLFLPPHNMRESQGLESSGSDMPPDTATKSDKKTKRHLSAMEEEILLGCMKEIIANGWKSDNGFRGGYLHKLEELIRKELPGTDLKGLPHINSKLQTWKKNYNSLTAMLSLSGIGFRDHMIECGREQWEHIVKLDANAKSMRNRKWPMYDAWKEIFGNNRATGENAEDVLDAVNELFNEEQIAVEVTREDYYVSLDQVDGTNVGDNSACGSGTEVANNMVSGRERGESVTKSTTKKLKLTGDTKESITEVLREISHASNERLEKIANRIGYEYDLDEARKDAFGLLEDIPGLSLYEKFDICDIFALKTECLQVFKGLPESARTQYLQRLLQPRTM